MKSFSPFTSCTKYVQSMYTTTHEGADISSHMRVLETQHSPKAGGRGLYPLSHLTYHYRKTVLKTGSHYEALASLKLFRQIRLALNSKTYLPLFLKCWD